MKATLFSLILGHSVILNPYVGAQHDFGYDSVNPNEDHFGAWDSGHHAFVPAADERWPVEANREGDDFGYDYEDDYTDEYYTEKPAATTAVEAGGRDKQALEADTPGIPPADHLSRSQREVAFSSGILLVLSLCLASMALGHQLSTRVHRVLNTPMVAIILGFLSGLTLWILMGTETDYILQRVLVFNENIFFVFLLPPIIFASGFNLNGRKGVLFFYRFGTILWFALFATFLSFAMGSIGLWLSGVVGVSLRLSFKEAFILGAILSPTDPITVLSIFRDIQVNPVTEMVIVGESLLNDAVAILLYRLIQNPSVESNHFLLAESAKFVWQFVTSVLMGLLMCLVLSLIMKVTSLKWLKESQETINSAETAVTLVSPWMTYLLAEKIHLSGVVAVLFCGIGMARYTLPNFTQSGASTAENVYESFSSLAETVVFLLLGLAVFSFPSLYTAKSISQQVLSINLHIATLIVISLSRFIAVYGTAGIVNLLLRRAHRQSRLPPSLKAIVALSGLRGAVTVALALQAKSDLGHEIGDPILSTCLFYTLATILVMGPSLPFLYKSIRPDPISIADMSQKPPPQSQPNHLLLWRHFIYLLRKLDIFLFNLVTRRSEDGGFWGDVEPPEIDAMDEELDEELDEQQFFNSTPESGLVEFQKT